MTWGARITAAVSRYGARGLLLKVGRKLSERLVYAESHIWYELDLATPHPPFVLDAALVLRRGGHDDLPLLEQLDTVWPDRAIERLRLGNDWWLVVDEKAALFSCWVFRDRTPVLAADNGELILPPGLVCLEDSVTSAAARGRGIAPAAWVAIADTLAAEGQRKMITKVTVENTASRRAVTKAGFDEIALMNFRRRGPTRRTSIEILDPERGAFFAQSFS